MTNSKILNAKQLLLLCIIRKEAVRAKNLSYFGVFSPVMRSFMIHFEELLLVEQSNNTPWYNPFSLFFPKYGGEFELESEMTNREKLTLCSFCPSF